MPLITPNQNPLIMSSQTNESTASTNTGAQSPPPESQSSKQIGAPSSGKTSDTDQTSSNQEFLKLLDSNPAVAAMDPTADAKTRKPGKPLDGL